ncbi:hypothetical protein GUJ93_ZPchr0002g26715 [Zizania palustris]|uniref:Uncharacterized protein n=1 Tax=Zizania palustris TaxID=103762 RepID=A0A8J5RQ61_ZIZPA|nr:hypothetical protein GUJ93_ZPchr0002g26715 [Zizania palustris]
MKKHWSSVCAMKEMHWSFVEGTSPIIQVRLVLPIVLLGCGDVSSRLLRHIVVCRPLYANQGVAIWVVSVIDNSSLLVADDFHSSSRDDALLTDLCTAKSSGRPYLPCLLETPHCKVMDVLMCNFRAMSAIQQGHSWENNWASPSDPKTFPFILLGNKIDVDGGF